jgi:glutaredoxin
MVIVYGTKGCGSCEMVKASLTKNGIPFEYELLDEMDKSAGDAIIKLALQEGIRTMPVIMDDGNVVTLKKVLDTYKEE